MIPSASHRTNSALWYILITTLVLMNIGFTDDSIRAVSLFGIFLMAGYHYRTNLSHSGAILITCAVMALFLWSFNLLAPLVAYLGILYVAHHADVDPEIDDAPVPDSSWSPMDTAPKDRHILLKAPDGMVFSPCRWDDQINEEPFWRFDHMDSAACYVGEVASPMGWAEIPK